jgi:hypothetical protein
MPVASAMTVTVSPLVENGLVDPGVADQLGKANSGAEIGIAQQA